MLSLGQGDLQENNCKKQCQKEEDVRELYRVPAVPQVSRGELCFYSAVVAALLGSIRFLKSSCDRLVRLTMLGT